MPGKTTIGLLALASAMRIASARAQDGQTGTEVVISVAEQRMAVLRDGMLVSKYRVSTSKFGLGDSFGSYKTPVGKLRVCEKIGDNFAPGAVIKNRHATGEILPVNAPGRDPIVTRVLWLDGLEERNKNAKSRGIYIHGTVEEAKIGAPVSYGCIRMRSREVADVFESVPVGSLVTIQPERLAKYRRWTPLEPVSELVTTPDSEAAPLRKLAAAKPPEPLANRAGGSRDKGKSVAGNASGRADTTNAAGSLLAAREKRGTQTPSEHGAGINSLNGSILFADIPPHTPKAASAETLESIRGPVLAGAADVSPKDPTPSREEPAPLPRVTFRIGPSVSTLVERAP